MKLFTIIKTGYSAGIYGCSDEYFTLIVIDTKKKEFKNTIHFHFKGLYGEESRVAEQLKNLGYKEFYTSGAFGKIPSREYKASYFNSIEEILEDLKTF